MESTSISLSARFRSMPLAEFRLVSRSQAQQCFKLPRHAEDRLAPTQANIVLPSQTKWTPSPIREIPTSSSAPSTVETPSEVPRTESIRAVVVGPYDEDPTTLFEYQPNEPQFIESLDTNEYEKETIELLSQVPRQHHNYLDIFRKKGGTETLPPPRAYDMRVDNVPSPKLAVAKLYQLTEDQRIILLDTLKRETEAGRIRSNAAYVCSSYQRRMADLAWLSTIVG